MIPSTLEWVNVARLRMDQQLGRPVLVEFWDFCRSNSLRTLPYVRGWHERYAAAGLRVISAHAGGYPPSRDPAEVRAAVARLGIEHPVVIDGDFELWQEYGNEAWPARYLFDQRLRLYSMHYGEGAYAETEREICELLDQPCEPLEAAAPRGRARRDARRAERRRGGRVVRALRGRGVWAVLERTAPSDAPAPTIRANGREIAVAHSGCVELVAHERHSAGELELELGDGVVCHAVQFTPGIASPAQPRPALEHPARRAAPDEQRSNRGGPSSSRAIAPPGQ